MENSARNSFKAFFFILLSGIFFDCVNSKKNISLGLLLCALGTLCFAALWGVPFLEKAYSLDIEY